MRFSHGWAAVGRTRHQIHGSGRGARNGKGGAWSLRGQRVTDTGPGIHVGRDRGRADDTRRADAQGQAPALLHRQAHVGNRCAPLRHPLTLGLTEPNRSVGRQWMIARSHLDCFDWAM